MYPKNALFIDQYLKTSFQTIWNPVESYFNYLSNEADFKWPSTAIFVVILPQIAKFPSLEVSLHAIGSFRLALHQSDSVTGFATINFENQPIKAEKHCPYILPEVSIHDNNYDDDDDNYDDDDDADIDDRTSSL